MNSIIHNITPEAAAVVVERRTHEDDYGHAVEEINFRVPNTDFSLGTKVKNDKLILLHIGSPSNAHAAKGHGFATFQRAIKYAADHDLRFFVNEFVPPRAAPLVHKLVRHGYDVREPQVFGDTRPSLEIGTTENSFTRFDRDWI